MKILHNTVIILLILSFPLFLSSFVQAQSMGIKHKTPMPTPRYGACSAVLDNGIYVIGGKKADHGKKETTKIVERYDPSTNSWDTNIGHLEEKRYNATAVAFKGKIYLFGGKEDDDMIKKIEVYDPATNKWKELDREMPFGRVGASAVVFNDKIWIIGGYESGTNYLNRVDIFDPETYEWSQAGSGLDVGRASFAAVAFKDTIFVLGGYGRDPLRFVERYTPDSGWVTITEMKEPRASFAAFKIGKYIYIIGGESPNGILGSIDKFDLTSQEWSETDAELNKPRKEFTAQLFGDKIYIFGGIDNNENVFGDTEELSRKVLNVADIIKAQPVSFKLLQNYPNPFNSLTKIEYQISGNETFFGTSHVNFTIYNLLGERVIELINENQTPGIHQIVWDGRNYQGIDLPTGYYLGVLRFQGQSETIKIQLLR